MPKKIFELAKEINIGPLDLVERLKKEGLNVRNHMSSLSDEDVEKVLLMFKEEDKKSSKTEGTKKKATTRKKRATKKASKKILTVKDGKEVKKTKKTKAKTEGRSSVKRKTVIRRKTSDHIKKEADSSENLLVETTDVSKVQVEDVLDEVSTQKSSAEGSQEAGEKTTSSQGLRVVSRPEGQEAADKTDIAEKESKTVEEEGDKKELFKEKVHKFTPVYIPPKEEVEAKKKEEAQESQDGEAHDDKKSSGSADGSSEGEGTDEKIPEKKRLSGLATMISGKQKNINRSKIITQSRADEELKSYSTLSSTGKPLYTSVKRKKTYLGPSEKTMITEVKESKRFVVIHGGITIEDLAYKLSVKFEQLRDKVLDLNLLVKADDYIGPVLASKIAACYDYRIEDRAFKEEEVIGKEESVQQEKEKLPLRDPVITIMGHVDHGKTTLLDYIRNTKVAANEAGGITQHIGAYSVKWESKNLTFLDTPGHAAFGAMRQRGADITDIVVLIVAADDGVMPQTKESIRFCQQANRPIIVAVNKMDKEGVNVDRIKQELSEFNITPEEWGGDVQFVAISALKGTGVDDLLEAISLQAEMLELHAGPKGNATGVVIEAKIEQGRGPVVNVLVTSGTLKKGDSIVVGECYGRARSLMDFTGKQLKSAGPSMPVQILGLNGVPAPGDSLNVVKNERECKKIVINRINERKSLENVSVKKTVTLEDFFADHKESTGELKTLNLIIRSDVQGSYEAIKSSIESLSNMEVKVKVIGGGVGPINDNDINLAHSAGGIIIGFNMRPVTSARRLSEELGVEVKNYAVIYELINDIKLALEGLLEPETIETFIGRAEVKEIFNVPKIGVIAGSAVIDGKIQRGCNIRLLRQGKIIFDGKMSSLKRFKDDVKEVGMGLECGIGLENFNDVKVEDIFEAYMLEKKKRKLEDIEAQNGVEQNS